MIECITIVKLLTLPLAAFENNLIITLIYACAGCNFLDNVA